MRKVPDVAAAYLKSRLQVARTRSSLTSSGRWKLLLGTMNMKEKVNISFFINYHKMIYKILNKIIVHLLHQANYSYRFRLIKTHQDYLNDTHLIT